MTVYVVYYLYFDISYIAGVFSSEEKAKAYIEKRIKAGEDDNFLIYDMVIDEN